MPLSQIFNVANMSFNAIRENKVLMKTSEFTVFHMRKVTLYILGNIALFFYYRKIFQEYHQSVIQFVHRSGTTKCRA